MPSFSFARRSPSGSAIHAFMRGLVLLPRNTARNVSLAAMIISLLRLSETKARIGEIAIDRKKLTRPRLIATTNTAGRNRHPPKNFWARVGVVGTDASPVLTRRR